MRAIGVRVRWFQHSCMHADVLAKWNSNVMTLLNVVLDGAYRIFEEQDELKKRVAERGQRRYVARPHRRGPSSVESQGVG